MLMFDSNITLGETILLDRVQKHIPLENAQIELLRKRHLIEGRKPNLYVAKLVAQKSGQRIEYSKHKGLEDKKFQAILLEALKGHGKLSRSEIDKLLWNLLSDQLTDRQKKYKITNILKKLKSGSNPVIINETHGNQSEWSLVNSSD